MQEHGYRIEFISRLLKRKVFQYSGDFYQFPNPRKEGITYEFKYRVKKVNDIKMMIHTGDWKPVIFLEVELFDFDDEMDYTFKNLLKALRGSDNVEGLLDIVAKPTLWEIKGEIREYLMSAIGFEGTISVTKYDIQFKETESINETKAHRLPIQKMIKDVVSILKKNQEGEFYLPEDINDEMVYNFTNVKDISVELTVRKDDDIKRFAVNGNYVKDQDVIEVLVVVNPDENINKLLYDIIGELNDLFAHELEHYRQYKSGEFELEGNEGIEDPLEYYTRPEEIKAQLKGFKRLSKIRRIPLNATIRNWFETHEDIHHLNNKDKEKVINTLLQNA